MSKKIIYLSSEGIHDREIKGISQIEENLPKGWFGYANLILFSQQTSPEYDLILITHDRVIIVELKDWNGQLSSINNQWFLNGNHMGGSPVQKTWRKQKALLSFIIKKLKDRGIHKTPYIDYCVVLSGSASQDHLPEDEKSKVTSLPHFSGEF